MVPEIDPLISETIGEFSEILFGFGFKKSAAKIVIFLHASFEASNREICRGTGMSLCQVTRGLQILRGRELIQIRKGHKKMRGKRQNLYSLTRSVDDILKDIETKENDKLRAKISRLRMLCSLVG